MRAAGFLPLLAPVLVLAVLLVPKVDRTFFPTVADRVTASPSTDTSARWRLEAYAAVWKQVRESPLTGVGFGLPVTFVSNDIRYTVAQDPHNQFLYLWAGGGLLLVGSFSLLLAVYLLDAWSRFRRTTIEGRHLIFWAGSLWFVFVINSLTGIILTQPDLLLIFWILMLLPMIVHTSGKRVAT
jgi:O-antigen ligase